MSTILGKTQINFSGTAHSEGQELIATLLGFMGPIIQMYVPSLGEHAPEQTINVTNLGSKLITALEEFLAAVVKSRLHFRERANEIDGMNPAMNAAPMSEVIENVFDPTPDIDVSEEIQTGIHDALRPHVFNKMPIRLLSFDSSGDGICLIERSEVLLRVQQKMRVAANEPEFVADWMEASQMTSSNSIDSWKLGYTRKKELVNDLVSRYAQYAILSHTWTRDTPGDVVYKDWKTRQDNARGYVKIKNFCKTAATNHGVTLGWMDTVCINKDSSSELDESIRSMYKWYRGAQICLAYLADTRVLQDIHSDSWFTRGWTLQELLAPQNIHFYNTDWDDISSSPESDTVQRWEITEKIQKEIQEAASITNDEFLLCRNGHINKLPASRIFQLATYREVTREEDTAYSLMGLLGVDISVAYGEGSERAFSRLVRELLTMKKHVLDIFNHVYWRSSHNTLVPTSIEQYSYRSAAFDDPDDNASSLLDQWQPLEPIIVTHLGVRIPLLLLPAFKSCEADISYTPLGDISGTVNLYILSESEVISEDKYYLLDRRLFEGNMKGLPSSDVYMDIEDQVPKNTFEVFKFGTESSQGPENLVSASKNTSFAVFNFGVDNNDVLLPQQCMSVLLDCGKIKPGEVHPSDKVTIMSTELAPVFELGGRRRIPIDDLSRHGMQIVTLYL